ncbi:MAG TPA: hypothetical protein VH374_01895 [Polyangia bacterium]|jgi:hypothetical protein|nr:hypothetical protein [Polyangia bacterium]
MLFIALGSFALMVLLMVLDLLGVTPGAAGFSNILLLTALFFLGLHWSFKGIFALHDRHRLHHM